MITLNAYQLIEDAWLGGVADWCRAASPFVLGGGRAWMVTASDGQANWIKQRLLSEGISLFGVHFLDARALRRELCLRAGLPPPVLDQETLRFLLRLHAMSTSTPGSEWSSVARHPEACLAALDDFAAAGWLDEIGLVDDVLPSAVNDWLPALRATGSWTPDIDKRLADAFGAGQAGPGQLSLCVFGWDADHWTHFDLLSAAVQAADSAYLYMPLPRETSQGVQLSWLEACEARFGVERRDCDASGFESEQAALVERLEGADLDGSSSPPKPALLTGVDADDTLALVRDYVARWLSGPTPVDGAAATGGSNRLAILCPGRNPSAVALVRALAEAGIAVEDQLGELPEPALAVQIQRALLDYHLDRAGLEPLLSIVELLNEHAAIREGREARILREVFPLDPVEVRRALHGAFAEVQHHSARLLREAVSFARTSVAKPLRRLIEHLGEWPESLPWNEALGRWEETLDALGLTTEVLEPLWSRLGTLPVPAPVPSAAFFHYLGAILGGVPVRRDPDASHRFARVVVTTLAGAVGQTWGGLLLLDANEGAWPLYPPENPFLSDGSRTFLNARRAAEMDSTEPGVFRGHLLTASDRAQLEHFHFLEALQNCGGPLAFAAASCDPVDPNKEFYPNEWVLRCLVETGRAAGRDEPLLDRWRGSIRRSRHPSSRLAKGEAAHLAEVFGQRRDPAIPFDEYFFNFITLTGPDELPWAEAWSAGELDAVWNRPATFALGQIFGTEPWRDDDHSLTRGEGWMVGRLVHRWLHVALDASHEPRRLAPEDWTRALTHGLPRARTETESGLLKRLTPEGQPSPDDTPTGELPLWWQGVLRKAAWATRRCLETLAETAARQPDAPVWLCMNQKFQAELGTSAGPLRLRAQCDVVLLDRPEIDGAVCQLIDIRTGSAPTGSALTASQLQQGKGLHTVATLMLALAAGAEPNASRAGIVHPDASDLAFSSANAAPLAQPALERLARQQRSLVFGQKGALVNTHDQGQTEDLPLATTPVEPSVLAAKAGITAL